MSNPIVKALEHAAAKLGKTLGKDAGKAIQDLYHGTGHRMKKVARNHAENDAKHAAELNKLLHGGKKDMPHAPHATGSGAGKSPGSHGSTAREQSRGHPQGHTRTGDGVCAGGSDPVDMATGKMFLLQTDVELPGSLPLLFSRRVESGYHVGRWLGPSWSSTADQRLEIDDKGIVFVTEDGLLLSYPHLEDGASVLPASGPRWPLERDENGDYAITDPAIGRTWHFTPHSDALALLDEVSDRNGQWISFDYDAEGAPTAIRHGAGYHLKLTTADGRITALHLAGAASDGSDQELIRYGYGDGNLIEVTGSSGRPLCFEYDDAGRVISWTDTNDSRYDYHYDDQNRCVAEGGVEGHVSLRLTYDQTDPDTGLRVTTTTDSLGHTSRFLVNDALQVVAEIDPLGGVERTERDRYDRVISTTDPLGRTTRLTYDEAGNLTSVIRPDGSASTAAYNDLNLAIEVTDPDGATWRQAYDQRGNRTSVTDPSGATTRYDYDSRSHLTAVTNPLGHTTRVECDPAGLPVKVTDPQGAITAYRRDAFGRITSITDPLGHTTHLAWTVEGQLTSRIGPDGTGESWTYDGEGNCTSHTDAVGGVTSYEYTHFDEMSAWTGPDGARYEFTYDTNLQLTTVTNPQGLDWTYEYDPVGRLNSETDFDRRTLTYSYDAAGQLLSRTNALGQTVSFTHDVLGQVTEKSAGDLRTTFAYDPAGRLLQAANSDAILALKRDQLGRILSETVNGRTLTTSYDVLGNRTYRRTPMGAESAWAYSPTGNRTALTVSGHEIGFAYDASGREIARRLGETVTLSHTWSLTDHLSSQSLTAATRTIQHRRYTYRPDGNLTSIDDRLNGSRTFDLDRSGRVTAVHAHNWSEAYAYDDSGNQTQADWPAKHPGSEARGPRTYTGNRITAAGQIRYEHDAQGRISLRQKTRLSRSPDTWHYTWDAEDHLTSVTTPDGQLWRYLYDPLGRRIAKRRVAADGTILEQVDFTWDGSNLVEQTTHAVDLPCATTLTWEHDGLQPIAQVERKSAVDASQQEVDQRFFAIVTDLVGAPTELIDEVGNIAWRTRTTLWGTTAWAATSTAYTPLRFPGQYFDPETGFHYNVHRYYDPETARYTAPDPLGLAAAPNPATYVHNPHAWTDPLGLAPKCKTVIRHYTTKESYNKIMSGGSKDSITLKVPKSSKGKNSSAAYVTPMGPDEILKKKGGFKSYLGLTKEKSQYMIEFEVDKSLFPGRLKGGRSHIWFSSNDVQIPRGAIKYHGRTPGVN
ncbi:RHS repeat protein [Streptomyces sioyaensis]|uniref:RHS repeat-associated core domain-containing protein n=1 Tax=Streptomyces sioyaensis TaxID=67364 RepID=UPI001F1C9E76|nr:RHS repeat-associated core domain-containing protein [Streptomyces sioyaensis]MCF3176639.1 RHS repeat protein [Streptomyces sioyaensis]